MNDELELKLRAVEIAERTLPTGTYTQVGSSIKYEAKDMRELFIRADRIVSWATGTEDADKSTLIAKLKAALCDSP